MNSGILKRAFFSVCIFFIVTVIMLGSTVTATVSDYFFHVAADKSVVSSSTPVAAELVYYKDFLIRGNKRAAIDDCSFTDKQPKMYIMGRVSVLHCREHIDGLFPRKQVIAWKQEEKNRGYILLHLPGYGVESVKAWITAVSEVGLNGKNNIAIHGGVGVVTGIFKRHMSEVNTYIFKSTADDTTNNKLMTVLATPEHPFYVKIISAICRLIKFPAMMNY